MFRALLDTFGRSSKKPARKKATRAFRLESLEDRRLMAFGGEFFTGSPNQVQLEVATASSANGMSVMAWSHRYSPTDIDIQAQVFNADGSKRGAPIVVASSSKNESDPSVAMDANGNFVVSWTLAYSASDADVHARKFSPNGVPVGSAIDVASTGKSEYESSVAMDASGNFIVAYTLNYSATDLDVMARRFNSAGAPLSTNFAVASSSLSQDLNPSVAATDDGRFMIAYQTAGNIEVARYAANGNRQGVNVIANTAKQERAPSISMDAYGNAIVAWQLLYSGSDRDIYARRISNTGVLGNTFAVEASSSFAGDPSVALTRGGVYFAVAYMKTVANVNRIEVTQGYTVNGATTLRAPQVLSGPTSNPSISVDGANNYLVGYVYPGFNSVRGRWGGLLDNQPTKYTNPYVY